MASNCPSMEGWPVASVSPLNEEVKPRPPVARAEDVLLHRPSFAQPGLPNVRVQIILSTIERCGLALEDLLIDAGLPGDGQDYPADTLTDEEERALTASFVKATISRAGLWFQMGLQQRLLSFGPLGLAALTAPNLGCGLRNLETFSGLCRSLLTYRLIGIGDDVREIVAEPVRAEGELKDFLVERAAGALFAFINDINPGLKPLARIELAMAQRGCGGDLSRACGIPVTYGGPITRIVLRPGIASVPNPMADTVLHQTNLEVCRRLDGEMRDHDPFVEQVGREILRTLPAMLSAKAMSEALDLSERTLHRRLAACGMTYGAICDEVRRHRAAYLLERTKLSVSLVAEALGYAENASFTRAFKRWTGQSPRQFRIGVARSPLS